MRKGGENMSVGWCFFIVLLVTALAKVKPQSYSLPYQETVVCRNRTAEYLVKETRCCSKCHPGTRLATECTSETDTVCKPCADGMFSENMNYYRNCFLCDKCSEEKGLEYAKPCTRDGNSVCVCKTGWHCILDADSEYSCSGCKKHKTCSPGKGAQLPGTSTRGVTCINCPPGTFSNETSSRECQPHTRCELESRSTRIPGTPKTDTVCGPVEITSVSSVTSRLPIRTMSTASSSSSSSSKQPSTTSSILVPLFKSTEMYSVLSTHLPGDKLTALWTGLPVAALLAVLLTLTLCICHRKAKGKPVVQTGSDAGQCCDSHVLNPTENHGLLADSSSDPSTASSSDSHSQGTGVSQDCLHIEQPNVSSPVLNLSFTATINCQVNPSLGSCSIPISPCVHLPEPEFPLSQEEELCVSCEQEDSKDAIQSVQESGMTKY